MKISKNRNNKLATVLINYSNNLYKQSQKKNTKTALELGGFSKVISYSPKDIDKHFYNNNKQILSQKRGGGYWLWKPYFIKKTLENLNYGDRLFYSDSGCFFIKSIEYLLEETNQDIVPFELHHFERCYTKRSTMVAMDCDEERFSNTKQRLGGFILLKKTEFTLKFIDEWLNYSSKKELITDLEDKSIPNFPDFIEHRHDQSIFSLLTKKYNIEAFRDPSQWGNVFMKEYENSNYPQFIELTRKKNSTLLQRIKRKIIK